VIGRNGVNLHTKGIPWSLDAAQGLSSLLWLIVAYLGALGVLLVSAFWTVNGFTGDVVREPSLDNFATILRVDVYRNVALRSIGVAAAVTVITIIVALPMALFMAKVASPRSRHWLVIAILTPLWASYLVKVYAWRLILSQGGLADWMLRPFGMSGPGFGLFAAVIALELAPVRVRAQVVASGRSGGRTLRP